MCRIGNLTLEQGIEKLGKTFMPGLATYAIHTARAWLCIAYVLDDGGPEME